jgi:hypothetical protein
MMKHVGLPPSAILIKDFSAILCGDRGHDLLPMFPKMGCYSSVDRDRSYDAVQYMAKEFMKGSERPPLRYGIAQGTNQGSRNPSVKPLR